MNRRQQKTRTAIFNAFLSLLSKKNYNKITVQNIIDKADVGRSTFYSHFETKDDLIKEFCTELFEHIFSEDMENECNEKFSGTDDLEKLITHILYHLKKEKSNLQKILICESSDIFIFYMKKYIFNLIETQIFTKIKRKNVDIPEMFLKNHIATTFIETVKWWLINKMEETPEEISRYFLAVIKNIV